VFYAHKPSPIKPVLPQVFYCVLSRLLPYIRGMYWLFYLPLKRLDNK